MSWNILSDINPEFVRYAQTSLPKRRAMFVAALTIALILVAGWFNWSDTAITYMRVHDDVYSRAGHIQAFGKQSYEMLTVTLFLLLFILAPAITALTFVQERMRGTSVFQQTLLMSPLQSALGKFFGSATLSYFIAALILPFAITAAVLGEIPVDTVMRIYLFLFLGGLCCQSVALYISAAISSSTNNALRGGLLISPVVAVLGAITALGLYNQFLEIDRPVYGLNAAERWGIVDYELIYLHFYGIALPRFLALAGILLFVGVCAFTGAVRRIKVGQLMPVKPYVLLSLFIAAEILLVGFLWEHPRTSYWGGYSPLLSPLIRDEFGIRFVCYLFINLIALPLLAGSYALNRSKLREWWSEERNSIAILNRKEIKGNLKTFAFALLTAEAGIVLLWMKFHQFGTSTLVNVPYHKLFAIMIGFAVSIIGIAAFVQYCAMRRFRIGGWAGIALAAVFYICMIVTANILNEINSVPALLNPALYAHAVNRDDPYMYVHEDRSLDGAVLIQKETLLGNENAPEKALIHGLIAEGLLAFGCVWLARSKWRKTRAEMLHEQG